MRKKIEKFFKPKSLSLKLMRVVFALYLLVTFLVTCGQMWAEFERTHDDISNELLALSETMFKPVTTSIWQMNQLQLNALGHGLVSMPTIEGVDVINASDQNILSLREFTDENVPFQLFSIEKILTWKLKDKEIPLGSLRLYSSSNIILDRVFFGFALITLSAIIKFSILWALFTWAFKRFLEVPLTSLMSQIDDIKLERIGENRISLEIEEFNELIKLQNHTNHMLDKIAADKEGLVKAEKERRHWLEQEVAARTQELSEANKRLAHLAATDALTNIRNHRTFFEQGQMMVDLSIRQQHPLCLLVLDLDFFKKTNDTHGHSTGDQVLRKFVQQIEKRIRKTDLFGRVGGEEFAILLNDTKLDAAVLLAEEMCQCIKNTQIISDEGKEVSTTVSIGVCAKRNGDLNIHQIFKRSDALLYKAKRNGRNRVESST